MLKLLRVFRAQMTYQESTHKEPMYAIRNQKTALLNRNACFKLGLLTYHVQETTSDSKQLSSDFHDLVKGLGLLKNYSYKTAIKSGVTSTCLYISRTILLQLRERNDQF